MGEGTRPLYIFIGNPSEKRWPDIIEEALPAESSLEVADENSAMQSIVKQDYEAVFIDFSAVRDFTLLISRIRAQRPEARVVVIAKHDWKLARDAFLSGATDYIIKSQTGEGLVAMVRDALEKPVRAAMAAGGGY